MDYRKYRCNLWERLGCLAAGTAVAAAIAWLFYRSWYGMVLVIPVNYLIVSYYKNKKRVYIISILQTKDYNTIIKELSEDNEAVFYFTNGVQDRPYVPAKTLKEEAIKYIEEERVNARNLEEAIKEVKEKYKDRTIFIIGSFYVYKNVIKALKE